MASSLHGNGSFSRLQLANNKSFLNPNHFRRSKRIAIDANCANRNRINLSSKASDQLMSNCDRPNKRIPDEEAEVISKELDRWVRDSAIEIVRNLDEAPFLVHVYGDNGDGSTRTTGIKLVREKATAEDWPFIKKRWEGGSPTPNGIILVEDLEPKSEPDREMIEITDHSRSSTKKWGILIQGEGINCTACYLLKTSQVQSVAGFCTHFCLVRVDCFVEHADILLRKMWLQN
ncbi:uncharacterized protein LOC111376044 [Olea europaea var. sylvestris]|uniref:uncharacterized protein LOC111376044 n=1 Tax=Olea europaea var. sylvestris TaxID=158386 RepID=UPI000C1D69C2|nr:uncharacterized protein LOC111376044 [Olea europaea var. sylvestris]